MTTTTTRLVGSEFPRLWTPPLRELTPDTSRGFECVEFATDILGLDLMPWQRWALIHGLELAEGGSFRFRTLLVLTSRQAGKSTLLQVLALWRMFVDGAPLVLGTAQNLGLAEETWAGALQMAESVPELAREVAHVSRTNGDKYLRLTGGERYKVSAATRSGGRGLSSDLVLLDELREHRDWQAWSAFTKTTLARPAPQVLGFSNAGDATSVVLSALREKALASAADRTSTLGLFEWSAPDGCGLDDRAAWAAANPALGHRMTEDAIAAALEVDPEPVFRTEVLCQWVDGLDPPVIDPLLWAALTDAASSAESLGGFALDVQPGSASASVAVAGRRSDGLAHLELLRHEPGTDWCVPLLLTLWRRWRTPIVLDPTSPAGAFQAELERAGVTVVAVTRREYAGACQALVTEAAGARLRHQGSPALAEALGAAQRREIGEGGLWGWARRKVTVDISPLVAVTLALHGLATPPAARPGRFMSF